MSSKKQSFINQNTNKLPTNLTNMRLLPYIATKINLFSQLWGSDGEIGEMQVAKGMTVVVETTAAPAPATATDVAEESAAPATKRME